MNRKPTFAAFILIAGLGLILAGIDRSPRHVHGQSIYPVGAPSPLLRGSTNPVSSPFPCGSTLDGVQYLNQTTSIVWTCNGAASTWFTNVPVIAAGSIPLAALASGITTVNGTPCTLGSSCTPSSPGYIKGTSGTITGTLLAVGGTDSWTGAVTGALQGMRCGAVTTTDGTNPSSSVTLSCRCPSNGNVIVEVTAAAIATPATKIYNFTLYP